MVENSNKNFEGAKETLQIIAIKVSSKIANKNKSYYRGAI